MEGATAPSIYVRNLLMTWEIDPQTMTFVMLDEVPGLRIGTCVEAATRT